MIDLGAAAQEVLNTLVAAGISAAVDMADLNTPGVFIPPPTVAYRFTKRDAEASWRLVAAVANTGRGAALAELGLLVDRVQAALGGAITSAAPVDLASVDGGGPLPGYELLFRTRILDSTPVER